MVLECFLAGVGQRIHVGAGVEVVAVDEGLLNELVEVLVEAAVVDRVGVALGSP
jgi:F0F1-type ATP synthase membrane subunit c/vacuolar-type H+-ATPase subunit K